jgi:hypothetical protein
MERNPIYLSLNKQETALFHGMFILLEVTISIFSDGKLRLKETDKI